jgi:hypothetical protein
MYPAWRQSNLPALGLGLAILDRYQNAGNLTLQAGKDCLGSKVTRLIWAIAFLQRLALALQLAPGAFKFTRGLQRNRVPSSPLSLQSPAGLFVKDCMESNYRLTPVIALASLFVRRLSLLALTQHSCVASLLPSLARAFFVESFSRVIDLH